MRMNINIINRAKDCCRRFPVSVIFLLFFTIYEILYNYKWDYDPKYDVFFKFYLPTAALLATVLQLWNEDKKNNIKRSITCQCIAHCAWFALSIWIASMYPFDIVGSSTITAMIIFLFAAFFLVSFFQEKNDVPLLNFILRIFLSLAIALGAGLLLTGGCELLLYSFDSLFHANLNANSYIDVVYSCMFFITPCMFLQMIPSENLKHDESLHILPKFISSILHYLFIPLLGLYLLVLYIYCAKILLSWQLPDGAVATLVSILMAGMIIVLMLIYPSQYQEGHKIDKILIHWFPVLVLPLLLLMTVGVIRRFSDYGISVLRLYIAAFNLWCYGVCLWIAARRLKRFNWIIASFAIIVLLVSVGPQSFANITLYSMKNSIKSRLPQHTLPFTAKSYRLWRNSLKKDSIVADKLEYLSRKYSQNSISDLFDEEADEGMKSYNYVPYIKDGESITAQSITISDNSKGRVYNIKGYSKLMDIDEKSLKQIRWEGDILNLVFSIKIDKKENLIPVNISKKWLNSHRSDDNAILPPIQCGNTCVYIDYLYVKYIDTDIQDKTIRGRILVK